MKKIYVFIAIIIAISLTVKSSAQVPDTWTQKANFGGNGQVTSVGFRIGNKGHIGTGQDSIGNTHNFWEDAPACTITGPATVCAGSTGNVYSTDPGLSPYTWSVTGGTITAGGTTADNTATVTWNTAGAQIISVSDGACGLLSLNVTVNPLPAPTIIGPGLICDASTGNIYSTQSGLTSYNWTITGGTITSGIGTDSITVSWTIPGLQTLTVNYTDGNGCTAASPGSLFVVVIPLPTPVINGPTNACVGSTGNIYSTDSGMTGYTWSISAGGTITAGLGTDTVIVTWNTVGAQTISVNYNNIFNCQASSPTVQPVIIHALPSPTITGAASVCVNSTGNVYYTEAGMTGYSWSVSAGGTITGGGGTNSILVTWNTVGAQTVSVNYTNAFGCINPTPTNYSVTVNPLPIPTLSGPAVVCAGSTGNTYTTDAGMTNYSWTVSAGGTITAGGGTGNNTVTVKWNIAGAQTVTVNYSDGNGCNGASATSENVTVNALPVPSLSGPIAVCAGSAGNIYTTDAGMTNYIWTVSGGGWIIAGGGTGDNTVTITWNTAGSQTVTVDYTNSNGCSAVTATSISVTVNALPVPTIAGNNVTCIGASGIVYSTQAGMTNYLWTVSGGGTIIGGGGTTDNSVTVTWNTTGAQMVSVNYTDANGCTDPAPTNYPVTVNPNNTISLTSALGTDNQTVCINTAITNITYATTGATGVTFSGLPAGVTGNWLANVITISGTPTISGTFNYTITLTGGCGVITMTGTITVNARPVPTLTGPALACLNSTGNVYTTDAGMSNYIWTVSAGGTITAGGGTGNNTVTVTWNTAGAQSVSVSYTNGNGCTATVPTVYPVTVNPLPAPTITGPGLVCAASTGNIYTTQPGMTGYVWTVTGGTITAGSGTASITVTWNNPGIQTVSVTYISGSGCTSASPGSMMVIVIPLPTPTITGPNNTCVGSTGIIYTTESGMSGYTWSISAGGTITAGQGTNSVTVTWNTVGAQTISVTYNNAFGCHASPPSNYNVTVNPLPSPTITGPATACLNSTGNVYYTEGGMTGYAWNVSAGGTITTGSGTNSIQVTWNTSGAQTVSVNYTNVFGCFNPIPTIYNVTVTSLPSPSLSGPASVCVGSTGNIYTTDAGMTKYNWTVSAGGTITAGGGTGSNTVTVTWNTAGAQTVTVNYSDGNGCRAASPTSESITVNVLPVPLLTGPVSVCAGSTGNTYTTDAGMTNYTWTVSGGGTITAGGGTGNSTVTVTWNVPGTQTVTVNYSNSNGCTGVSATIISVTVNPEPVPWIAGNNAVCVGTSGVVYTTQPGMTNYQWIVSAGGTITSGGGTTDNTVTVTWNIAGAQTVSITYTGTNGCTNALPTVYPVTVSANSTIVLTSPAGTDAQTVCINTAITNIIYATTGATGATFNGLPAGVTGNWLANVVTISGTPTISGTFNYTITLTGGCGTVTKNGTITVTPNNTITLTSAAGTDAQTVCINTAITNITYSTTGATGATFAGLPAGVTGNWLANVVTISGTPTVPGTFNYTITLTGGCGAVTKNGSITVIPINTITLTSGIGTDAQTVCINTAITNITYSTAGATGATFSGLPAGVTGNWLANVVTISGTPTVSGLFNYTITLTGGCGVVTKNGSITVTPNSTITLTSGIGTDAQTVCINTAITNITYSTTGATGATFTGLPAGVTGNWLANVVTISGIPTVSGNFNYTITLTGGCGIVTKNGTITVTASNTITLTSAIGTDAQTVCINTAITNITYSTTGATGATFSGLPAGVTGNWLANVVTISGTPTVSGTFNYTITLTGGCGVVTKNGSITVTPNNTITLTSGVGTDAQTVCINTAITNITYSTTGATGATFTGLPAGVTGNWLANVVTISGTPTVSGTFNYTITLSGGCGVVTKNGSITVTPNNTITLTSGVGTDAQTVCINTAITNITYSTTGATGATFAGLPAGVTGNWLANVVTISGTPTVSGTFNYTITLTGGCGLVTKNGSIIVNPINTITLTSGIGTDAQTVCINTAITNITYSTTGATGATFAGLPAGVTGNWLANVVTISGTPTASGTFNYTITLTGGCGVVTKNGSITVTPNNTIILTSGAGTDAQSVCINTPITNITYSTTGATGATFTGLPAGVTGNWLANVVTISGTPTVSGTFNYTITLTGGCGLVTKNGSITVTPNNTISLTSAIGTDAQTVCINTAITNITYSTTGATGATFAGLPAGVTGNWLANVVTISGTPTVSGTFNYTITLTGGCGVVTKNGSITVTPINTITLTSGIGTDAQTVCINTAITNITYSTTGATGATFTGLPAGVTGNWLANVVTISGIPTVSGTFNYTITLTGGCGVVTQNGSITVTPNNTITLTSGVGTDNQTVCINTAITNITYSTTGATGATFAGLPAGVTGNWLANVVTISGTPTVSGTFNYTITLTGGCGIVTKIGTIHVNPINTITLTSGVGTDNQTVCINTSITNITYSTTGATGATFAGLPTGVAGLWFLNMVIIGGTPTVSGTFNYTITLTGGCGVVTKNGSITVTPNNTIILTSGIGTDNQTVCINTAITNITYSTTGATGATFAGLPAGVTGNWLANVVTISGTPTVSGPFNYTITLTGGCGVITKTGTITVILINTITLTSGVGTDAQTVCINTAITNITYSTTGATGATFAGLPAGVTGNWLANVVTISGTPTVSGLFNYTITLTGGCGIVTENGSITVSPNNTITLTSAIGTDAQTVCINTAITNITYSTTGATGATFTGLPAGVTGNWLANVVTISGTPTVSGTFNYTITLTGGCGIVTKNGTITVTPNNTITLTSGIGTDAQTVCINTAITNITYSTTGATGATYSGLPAGVTGNWLANVVTISGTPTVSGLFNYTITLTGGCGIVTKTGSITVSPNNTITLTSAIGTDAQTVCINTAITNITYSTTGATGATFTGLPAGVTGNWLANVVTISGTPTVSGTFNYTITLTGGCGVVTQNGTITVTPNNTITLTSGVGTDAQTVCINTAITNITYSTTGATGATYSGLPAGVTGNWLANVVTISGTPTVSGTFNYTITLTGGCGIITKNGTITVTPNNTITLTSAIGTDAQTVCINTAITNITYSTTGATGATFLGLPAGVTGNWLANVVTISGTPTVSGTFNYTITLTGGCGIVTKNGSITVSPNNTITLTSAIGTDAQTVCINTAITNITYSTTGATGATFFGLPAGVTGNWLANVITISGTPTVSGTFNYFIILTGGCGIVTKNGTITVTPNNTITLTSAIGTDAQAVCINTAITNITYSTTGATGATFTGLPAGVTGNWLANVVTISGTPTVSGTFNYTITLTGGCGIITKNGTITVTPNNTITLTSAIGTDAQTVCINTAITNITYSTTGAMGATFAGLPAGVTGNWLANVVTISGIPTVSGTFNYTITLTGGCGIVTKNGSITVTPNNTITLTSGIGTDALTVCINTAITNITYSTTGATGATYSGLPAGVTGNWLANVVTISGTPTVSGTFNYTITLTGGCGVVTKNGTITVTPNNTIILTSGIGTDNQTVCINTAITNITYSTTGATGATFAGLPAGVTGNWLANVVTISGTPTVSGTFNYTITLTGGCGIITKNGTIHVNPVNTITLTSAIGTDAQTVCVNSAITNITYGTTTATGATFAGLPTGVTGNWLANVVTISGTPTVTGIFNYTITLTGGCGIVTKTGSITVNARPSPTITGPTPVCVLSTGNVYTTETGMSAYNWSVSAGGTITAGAGTNAITVTWNTAGAQTVSVNYANGSGCTALTPTVYNVTVTPTVGTPTFIVVSAGVEPSCQLTNGTTTTTYATTATNNTGFNWSISNPLAGVIGATTGIMTWANGFFGTVNIQVTANGCNGPSAQVIRTVNITQTVGTPTAITISNGIEPSCQLTNGTTTTTYSTTATNNTGFNWSLSNPLAGIIVATNGFMTWANGFSGTVNIQVTANGCNGPSAQVIRTVNVTPTVGTPTPITVAAGVEPTCQVSGTPTTTYATTATNNTGFNWSISNPLAGNIGATTGIMTWINGFTGTVNIQVTANGCNGPSAQVIRTVNVHVLPVPTITGNVSVCVGSTLNVYTTQAGMTNYLWNVSAGGTITAGGGTANNTVTITWNTVGLQSISVNYTNGNGCTAAAPTVYVVNVNPLPVPTITGPAAACVNSTGNIYTTETGMTAYNWSVSAGGVITAGTGTSSITVTWNIAGAQTVSVNYINGNGCLASSPTVKNVTVNPLPVPTITGLAAVCAGTAGVTYTTEAGMTGYTWAVSSGGTITAGAGTKTITVTWTTAGAQTVSVNYTNGNGCMGASPTVKDITVNPLPIPTINGANSVCVGATSIDYATEAGMTGYIWTVSAGGTITAGAGTNTITVTWNTAGAQTVRVNYTNSNGCTASAPTVLNVTVNPLPVPTITGPNTVCAGTSGVTYSTETGMTGYIWNISAGGTITSGTGTSTITVTWNTVGAQTVSVNYDNANDCSALVPTVKNVTVNALPVPTINGPASVCAGTTGVNYITEVGMTSYIWSISPGGVITSGTGTNSVMVTWITAGAQTISVNYTNINGCTATAPTVKNVTVNALPVPTITGSASVCVGTTGVNYSTETGMTGYIWNVSAGGTITSGNGTNVVTVTWNTAGAQTVSVIYTDANGCTPVSPTIKNVIVNPVYVPTITGVDTLCLNTQTYIYTTEPGMSNYIWSVSAGGTITGGGSSTSHTVTVRWNTAGTQWVSVDYTNSYGCSSPTATIYQVIVNPVPVPTITGNNRVCAGTTGLVYTTQAGMINYTWNVSLGGTITAGGTSTSNTVTVTWNTAGSQSVSVDYSNTFGCAASVPATFNVIVSPLPVPTLTGPMSVCEGTAGNVYTTQAGMSNYSWIVSSGGTITAGGSSGSNTVTVTWNTPGAQFVSVNYNNANGCKAASPTVLNVTVNTLPVPTISGPGTLCSGVAGVYTTETGKTNYTWTVSTGGTILAGGGTASSTITVKWTATGAQWVRINYTNSSGCRATTYTQFNITVNPLPAPTITGTATVCQGNTGIIYSTQQGMTGYTWTISTGGTITAGGGTDSITVSWTGNGAQWLKVNYANAYGCTAASPVQYNVTVNKAPVPSLNGVFSLCAGVTAVYSTDGGMTNYIWTVSAGGTIVSGQGTKQVNVHWITAGANTISVTYTPASGCPVISPTVKAVTVNAVPTPTITGPTTPCVGAYEYYSTETGMTNYQWFLGGTGGVIYSGFNSHQIYVQWTIAGAKTVSVNYTSGNGCSAPSPTVLNVTAITCSDTVISGIDTNQSAANFIVYPNPNNGKFTALIQCECHDNCSIDVYNMMGVKVFEIAGLSMESKMEVPIDLQNLPDGIYIVIFHNSNQWIIRKIVVDK